jgi:hypothetical protein
MPSTYTLISSNVLSTAAASVTFSAIPSTYTDLVVRTSLRSNRSSTDDNLKIIVNNDAGSTSFWSYTRLRGDGSTAASLRTTGYPWMEVFMIDGNTATSNTFSSNELYFPNYSGSQKKQISAFNVQEDNATSAVIAIQAFLRNTTDAISSLQFLPDNGTSWLSGSSFYLYGIKNS